VPDDITGVNEEAKVVPISWYHPHVFHSYPKALPRVTFQDPIIGPGLYYTSGMDSFISCMETNALMGKNVARLIADDILGMPSKHEPTEGSLRVECDRGRQLEVPKTRPTEPAFRDL